jgi:hypothetical protein
VLDPRCGSGTFLVKAYKRLAELNVTVVKANIDRRIDPTVRVPARTLVAAATGKTSCKAMERALKQHNALRSFRMKTMTPP